MDFKYMEEHGMIDPSYESKMKELDELFEKDKSIFNSDEEYLDLVNEAYKMIKDKEI